VSEGTRFFDERAADYDRLRPQDGAWWRRFDALVREGDLRGRRVLDIGCGTGSLAAALVERERARVWAVDASEPMLEIARSRAVRGLGVKRGTAERLPFRDGWFERAVMCLVVHHVDRPRAFAEAHRVLTTEGRLAIATFDHAHFDRHWAAPYFPTLATIDRARFPAREQLVRDLTDAGFARVETTVLEDAETIDRETAVAKLRAGHISTLALLPPDELDAGIERAERELPAAVTVQLLQLVVVACR
jgi:SAM-dependent methyltransferase